MIWLLSQFYGMKGKDDYDHLTKLEEVCFTLRESNNSFEHLKLKLFSFSKRDDKTMIT